MAGGEPGHPASQLRRGCKARPPLSAELDLGSDPTGKRLSVDLVKRLGPAQPKAQLVVYGEHGCIGAGIPGLDCHRVRMNDPEMEEHGRLQPLATPTPADGRVHAREPLMDQAGLVVMLGPRRWMPVIEPSGSRMMQLYIDEPVSSTSA